jgi:hypothetical protein
VRASTWIGRLLAPATLLLCLSLASPARADDEDKGKEKPKDKAAKTDGGDIEKIVQEVTKRVLAELRGEEKKGKYPDKNAKKGDKQGRFITVDLDKLPPELAKQLLQYVGEQKGGKKKSEEKETPKKGQKKEKDEDKEEKNKNSVKEKTGKKKEKDD